MTELDAPGESTFFSHRFQVTAPVGRFPWTDETLERWIAAVTGYPVRVKSQPGGWLRLRSPDVFEVELNGSDREAEHFLQLLRPHFQVKPLRQKASLDLR